MIYQVYSRSFADSNGDGIGDLRGRPRAGCRTWPDLGVDAVWLTPVLRLAAGRRRLRRGRLPRRRPDLRHPRRRRRADPTTPTSWACGSSSTSCPTTPPTSTRGSSAALRRGTRHRRARALPLPPGKGADGELPPNDWESVFGGPAWTRLPRTASGTCTCSPPSSPTSTGSTRRSTTSSARSCASGSTWASTASASTSPTAWSRRRACPTSATATRSSCSAPQVLPFFDQDGVHEIYRAWRTLLDEYPGERIGVAEAWAPTAERARAATSARTSCTRRSTSSYLNAAWDAAALRAVIDESLDASARSAPPPPGCCPTTTSYRHVTRFGGGEHRPAPGRAAAALLMLALPGSAYVYQGEELGLPEVVDLPDEVRQDPRFCAGAGQDGSATAAGCRSRGRDVRAAVRLRPPGGELAAAARRLGRAERRRPRPATRAPRWSCTAAALRLRRGTGRPGRRRR